MGAFEGVRRSMNKYFHYPRKEKPTHASHDEQTDHAPPPQDSIQHEQERYEDFNFGFNEKDEKNEDLALDSTPGRFNTFRRSKSLDIERLREIESTDPEHCFPRRLFSLGRKSSRQSLGRAAPSSGAPTQRRPKRLTKLPPPNYTGYPTRLPRPQAPSPAARPRSARFQTFPAAGFSNLNDGSDSQTSSENGIGSQGRRSISESPMSSQTTTDSDCTPAILPPLTRFASCPNCSSCGNKNAPQSPPSSTQTPNISTQRQSSTGHGPATATPRALSRLLFSDAQQRSSPTIPHISRFVEGLDHSDTEEELYVIPTIEYRIPSRQGEGRQIRSTSASPQQGRRVALEPQHQHARLRSSASEECLRPRSPSPVCSRHGKAGHKCFGMDTSGLDMETDEGETEDDNLLIAAKNAINNAKLDTNVSPSSTESFRTAPGSPTIAPFSGSGSSSGPELPSSESRRETAILAKSDALPAPPRASAELEGSEKGGSDEGSTESASQQTAAILPWTQKTFPRSILKPAHRLSIGSTLSSSGHSVSWCEGTKPPADNVVRQAMSDEGVVLPSEPAVVDITEKTEGNGICKTLAAKDAEIPPPKSLWGGTRKESATQAPSDPDPPGTSLAKQSNRIISTSTRTSRSSTRTTLEEDFHAAVWRAIEYTNASTFPIDSPSTSTHSDQDPKPDKGKQPIEDSNPRSEQLKQQIRERYSNGLFSTFPMTSPSMLSPTTSLSPSPSTSSLSPISASASAARAHQTYLNTVSNRHISLAPYPTTLGPFSRRPNPKLKSAASRTTSPTASTSAAEDILAVHPALRPRSETCMPAPLLKPSMPIGGRKRKESGGTGAGAVAGAAGKVE
ncbi:hypothetical protein BS50DRAFT_630430 [Corynespora cassiicola Philippines]|uniref:Uncharacterized protein n=1 Tax=Corynespora cassiicola Philippines TaxID=1448308 RepID=A0A2T2P3Z0_CORCC|nr:hypothetical protein BS50DRAFT_630430 [Corynespora cassiicola Philippines]